MSRQPKRGRTNQPDAFVPQYPRSVFDDLLPADRHPHLIFKPHQYRYMENTEALHKIYKKECECPRVIDWNPLEVVGAAHGIRRLFTQTVKFDDEAFGVNDLEKLIGIQENIYEELVMEFLATLEMFIFNSVNDRFLSFRLGGEPRSLTLKELGGCLGIYTDEEYSSHWIDQYIMTGARLEEGECNATIWAKFSSSTYLGGKNFNKNLKSPKYRVIHKMLANTLTLRGSNREKVTLIDLWFLDKLKSRDRINVPFAVGKFLHAYASGHKPNSKLCGGHLITRIAKGLKVSLRPRGVPAYTLIVNHTLPLGAESYATAQILRKKGGTYVAYKTTPKEAATVSRAGSRGKRPATSQDSDEEEEGEEEEEEEGRTVGTISPGQGSQHQAPAYWQGFMTSFDNMRIEQDRRYHEQVEFRNESRYEWGANRYQNDWLIHNHERLGHRVPDYQPTPYHHPPQWGQPGGVLPAPTYDRDAALIELQRHHQGYTPTADFQHQQQEWGTSWSSPPSSAPQHTWSVPQPSNWQQNALQDWLFGSSQPPQQQQDPSQDPSTGGDWS